MSIPWSLILWSLIQEYLMHDPTIDRVRVVVRLGLWLGLVTWLNHWIIDHGIVTPDNIPGFRSVVTSDRLVADELPTKFAGWRGRPGRVVYGRDPPVAGGRRPRRGAVETLAEPAVATLDQQPDVAQQVLRADTELSQLAQVQFESVRGRGVDGRCRRARWGLVSKLDNQQLKQGRYDESDLTGWPVWRHWWRAHDDVYDVKSVTPYFRARVLYWWCGTA